MGISSLLLWLVLCVWLSPSRLEWRGDLPGCQFPDYLQSKDPGMGDWTWKYDGDTHVGHVTGGVYTICSNRYHSLSSASYYEENCEETKLTRTCVRQHGPDMFAVQHGGNKGHTRSYQCIRYILRSSTVIQLAISDRVSNSSGICQGRLTLDQSLWISAKHYRTAVTHCPFTGGYNFMELMHFTRDHEPTRLCKNTQPPIRIESDCTENEGLNIHFREKQCVPTGSYFWPIQSLVCMASWSVDGYGFAMLRKEGERSFYCLRVKFKDLEVEEMVIYLDWKCYRVTDLSGYSSRISYSTPYVVFGQAEKRVISVPCSDALSSCSNNRRQCVDNQCMHSCQQCLNTTGHLCHFGTDVIGSWTIREPQNQHTKMHIHKSAMRHSSLGILKCVTFEVDRRVALRAILWGTYQNGCYPRFMCMYYDSPTVNVMRYRLGQVLNWPLELSDRSICSEENFMTTPDFNDPKDKYAERPWDIALKSTDDVHRMPCIFPSFLPSSTSFVTDQGRTGCVTLRSRFYPKSISMVYLQETRHPYSRTTTFRQHHLQHDFECVAAITYIDSYKTVLTLTRGHENEALCWMAVDARTLVVVNTSACNKQTAQGILRGEEKFLRHLKWRLTLNDTREEVQKICEGISVKDEEKWISRLVEVEETTEDEEFNAGPRGARSTFVLCIALVVTLQTGLTFLGPIT